MSEQKAEAKAISEIKENVVDKVAPTPPDFSQKSSAQALKERLQWGEPGLTIIDARDRESFLDERITGSMLLEDVSGLESNREIYIYSNSDSEAQEAANKLRGSGYEKVSQLQGGLAGWKAVQGPTEGRSATYSN